jgi:hypothetical protein
MGSLFGRKVTKWSNGMRTTSTYNKSTGKVSHARSVKNPITGKSRRSK